MKSKPYIGIVPRILLWLARLITRRIGLPPATSPVLVPEKKIPIKMSDGVILFADSWYPLNNPSAPVVLIRTPYGRGGLTGAVTAILLAQYGFRVITQSCRGTDGSGGEFVPFKDEVSDGADTVAWLRQQPWFSGKFVTHGASYVGYTQWAIAMSSPPELIAMNPQIAPIFPVSLLHRGGVFAFEIALMWTSLMPKPPPRLVLLLGAKGRMRSIKAAGLNLPLSKGYIAANQGRSSVHFENWLKHFDPTDPWWASVDFSKVVNTIKIPILLQGGWLDVFTAEIFNQYATLRERGVDASIMMADASHSGFIKSMAKTLPVAVEWFHAAFNVTTSTQVGKITGEVIGTNEWKSFTQWPPASRPLELTLQAGGRLSTDSPKASSPDTYRYDPRDPTPSIGGELLTLRIDQDNAPLIARKDVLSYTTAALEQSVEIVGNVVVDLWCSSSLQYTDFFLRLCDVAPNGHIRTVNDVIQRFTPENVQAGKDGVWKLQFTLPPTLCNFKRGHKIGLIICSAAYPRFIPNTGSGESLYAATQQFVADQQVYHDPDHPSRILLQVLEGRSEK